MLGEPYGYGASTGPYEPSNYERHLAEMRKYSSSNLMEHAAMNNARSQAAAREYMSRTMGGSADVRNERLFNTTQGALVRKGSIYAQNMYGSGNYVDLMAGAMNISANAGFGVSSFGRSTANMYGSGIATDALSKGIFDRANRYFSNANGTDNMLATQGADMTSVSKVMQIIGNSGRYKTHHMMNIGQASLSERLTNEVSNLSATGNTTGAGRIQSIISASGGDEKKMLELVNTLKADKGIGGDLKKALETASSISSSFRINDRAVEAMFKDTTDGLKALSKIRNMFGDLSEQEAFKMASTFTSGNLTERNALNNISYQASRMSTIAASRGMNVGEFAQGVANNSSVLSQIYGSAAAGGVTSIDYTNRLVTNQLLNQGSGRTKEQVAQSQAADTASVNSEQNMLTLKKLAFASMSSKDPAIAGKLRETTARVTKSLDPVEQHAALAELTSMLDQNGISTMVDLSSEEIDNALAFSGGGLGATVLNSVNDNAELAKIRTYEGILGGLGVKGSKKEIFTRMLKTLGSEGMSKFISDPAGLGKDQMDRLKKVGLGEDEISSLLTTGDGTRSKLVSAMRVADAKGIDTKILGSEAEENLERGRQAEVMKSWALGTDKANLNDKKSLLRMGIDTLISGGAKEVSTKDAMDYMLLTGEGGHQFGIKGNNEFDFSSGEAKNAWLNNVTGGDKDLIKQLSETMDGENGVVRAGELLQQYGSTIGVKDNKGTVVGKEEMTTKQKRLKFLANKEMEEKLGVVGERFNNESDDSYRERKNAAAYQLLKEEGIFSTALWTTKSVAGANSMPLTDAQFNAHAAALMIDKSLMASGLDLNTEEGKEEAKNRAIKASSVMQVLDPEKLKELNSELGESIMLDDKYESWRTKLGINLPEEKREELAESGAADPLAQIMMDMQQEKTLTKEQQDVLDNLGSGGGGNRTGVMHVTNMYVTNQKPMAE